MCDIKTLPQTLQRLLEFEISYEPNMHYEEELIWAYEENPHLVISLLLSQIECLMDCWRNAEAEAADLRDVLMGWRKSI